jgi:hypothetical protein
VSPGCVGEPVSWLRIERYHLGEIQGVERQGIADHLASCEACALCLARVGRDDGVSLPPLSSARTTREPKRPRARSPFLARRAAAVGSLSLAAALVLMLRRGHLEELSHSTGKMNPAESRAKGEAFAFTLVREDGERITGESGVYRATDRFKALVTCAPSATGANLAFDVVVYDPSGASFPLAPSPAFACGNGVPLPGAFRFTGDAEETVCLLWSDGGTVDRAKLVGKDAVSGGQAMCKRLRPAPER